MFRLEDEHLYRLLGLLCGASLLMLCIFSIWYHPASKDGRTLSGMQDFSEAWVCTYDTKDKDKLKEFQVNGRADGNTITEIVNLPVSLSVEKGKTATLTHKLPEMHTDTIFLTIQTNRQAVRVYVGNDILYSSNEADHRVLAYHVIPVSSRYKNMVASIELENKGAGQMKVGAVHAGEYYEVLVDAYRENGFFFIAGFVLIGISICLFVVWVLIKNTFKQKKLLIYSISEGLVLGMLFTTNSRLLQVISGWNFGIYLLRACLVILLAVLHLMVIRCFVNKKRVLFLVDIGIVFFGIFYVSVMVLQAFSLISFTGIDLAGTILLGISILLYTIVLAVAVYVYRRKECKIVFYANGSIVLCMLIRFITKLLRIQNITFHFYIICGFLIYMAVIWIYALKKAFYVETLEKVYDDETVRAQIIEQLNPNLLFASFHTLQNLIKSGSAKSTKMIYYISVYMRDNLKAMSQAGEMISFEEELEHMVAYLQLQKTRNQNLDFSIECKIKEFKVPRHSIEPLVENAVKHGIAGCNNKGNVVIRSYQRANGYAVQVVDDGIGFDKKYLKRESPTALLNLFTLLEKNCKAKTELISKEGKGTVITVILPVVENEQIEE